MNIRENILYDLLDQNTGEQVTYVKTVVGYDGTVITSENEATYIDGVIYTKLKAGNGGGYAKRVSVDGYGRIEWFVGNNFSNGINNLNAIKAINKAGLKLKLPSGDISLTAPSTTDSFINPNHLIWEGAGKDKTKVILETKHSDVGGSGTNAYFKGQKSVYFKDFELTTRSIEDGITNEIGSEYEFISIDDCEGISVEIYNCRMNGSIVNRFRSVTGDLTSTVKLFKIRNCEFNYVSNLFTFIGDTFCEVADVQDCYIYELLGTVLSLAAGGSGNKLVKWINNYVKNTIVPSVTTWYHCPVVTRCYEMIYERNVVIDLLNTDLTSRQQNEGTVYGAETYACYSTANKFYFRDNKISNISGKGTSGTSTCFKVKGATNVYCENNDIRLDKESLVKIGVLSTVDSHLNTVDIENYKFNFINSMNTDRINAEFVMIGNRINVPTINSLCYLPWGNFNISKNYIEVEYMPLRNGAQVFCYVLPDQISSKSTEKSILDDNFISIKEVEDAAIPVRFFTREGYSLIDSTTILRKLHSVSNNIFVGNCLFSLGFHPAKELHIENNKTFSEDTKLQINYGDFQSTDGSVVPLAKFSGELTSKDNPNISVIKPKLFGQSSLKITNNTQDSIRLMFTGLNDWYINSVVSSSKPILIVFTVGFVKENTNYISLQFNIAQTGTSNIKYLASDNTIQDFDPRFNSELDPIEVSNRFLVPTNAQLFMKRFSNRSCDFYMTGLSSVKELQITAKCWMQDVNSATFYDEWLLASDLTLYDLSETKADKNYATLSTKGLIKLADIPNDSSASDVATLVTDYNNLLQKLRDQNTE